MAKQSYKSMDGVLIGEITGGVMRNYGRSGSSRPAASSELSFFNMSAMGIQNVAHGRLRPHQRYLPY